MNEDYRIPLKCPFTGMTIYDSEGYHEPFPETMICYYEDEMIYLLPGLDIIEDIMTTLHNIEFYYKKKDGKIFKNIIKSFPWIKEGIESVSRIDLVSSHPLVKKEMDQNEYDSMNSGVYLFYFALASDHKIILENYKKMYQELLMIEEKLK